MEDAILKVVSTISWPGAFVLVILLTKPFFPMIIKKIEGGGDIAMRDRLKELEDFKVAAETNHFHDIDDLKQEVRDLREKMGQMSERLVRVETKLGNGHKL